MEISVLAISSGVFTCAFNPIEKENTINMSNIAFYDDKEKRGSRLGYKILEDGRKVRFSKLSGEVIDK